MTVAGEMFHVYQVTHHRARQCQLCNKCALFTGMSMMASVYTDEGERGRAMGIAFSGVAVGLVGAYTQSARKHTFEID